MGNSQLKEIHISEIISKKRIWCDKKGNYNDEYKYFEWLRNHNPGCYIPLIGADYFLQTIRNRIKACKLLSKRGIQKEHIGVLSVLSADFCHSIDKLINNQADKKKNEIS
jgi:hypothetical protein